MMKMKKPFQRPEMDFFPYEEIDIVTSSPDPDQGEWEPNNG